MNTREILGLFSASTLAFFGLSSPWLGASPTLPVIDVKIGAEALDHADDLEVVRGGPAQEKRAPGLQAVALFDDRAMPTGVAVSREGRIFLSFPRWGDPVRWTAVELRGDGLAPFPDEATNRFDLEHPERNDASTQLVSVQSVVADARDRLWLVDAGSIQLGPSLRGAPKLWAYDLASGQRVHAISFPSDVVKKQTYLNDVRVDVDRGAEGTAYLTDSGAGGIVVVDLASGASWRRLDGHRSVLPTPGLVMHSEGERFLLRKKNGEQMSPDIRSDGIALSPDGRTLYYSALASRDVWAVPTDVLVDRSLDEQDVASAVVRIATKPSGNDGLACDDRGRIYATDWEDNCIRRIDPADGSVEVVAQDERLLWPDSLAFDGDVLYVVTNQLARQPDHHFGKDLREPPYALFRLDVAGTRTAVVR